MEVVVPDMEHILTSQNTSPNRFQLLSKLYDLIVSQVPSLFSAPFLNESIFYFLSSFLSVYDTFLI